MSCEARQESCTVQENKISRHLLRRNQKGHSNCENDLEDAFDAVVCELEPIRAIFPKPQQHVQEVLILLPCVAGRPVPSLCAATISDSNLSHASAMSASFLSRPVAHLTNLAGASGNTSCCCPGGPGGRASDHRVGVAVQEVLELHGLPRLRGAAGTRDKLLKQLSTHTLNNLIQ